MFWLKFTPLHSDEDTGLPTNWALVFRDPVWSKNSSSLAVYKKLKLFNGDEFIEGTGSFKGRLVYFDERRSILLRRRSIRSTWWVMEDLLGRKWLGRFLFM
jgi:hypothetical protein